MKVSSTLSPVSTSSTTRAFPMRHGSSTTSLIGIKEMLEAVEMARDRDAKNEKKPAKAIQRRASVTCGMEKKWRNNSIQLGPSSKN
jgi:hypothetical protein